MQPVRTGGHGKAFGQDRVDRLACEFGAQDLVAAHILDPLDGDGQAVVACRQGHKFGADADLHAALRRAVMAPRSIA